MNYSACEVETTPRLAQWRIENFVYVSSRRSKPFKIGKWNWYFSKYLYVYLSVSSHVSFNRFWCVMKCSFFLRYNLKTLVYDFVSLIFGVKCVVFDFCIYIFWFEIKDFVCGEEHDSIVSPMEQLSHSQSSHCIFHLSGFKFCWRSQDHPALIRSHFLFTFSLFFVGYLTFFFFG